jgi:hypothetical protein
MDLVYLSAPTVAVVFEVIPVITSAEAAGRGASSGAAASVMLVRPADTSRAADDVQRDALRRLSPEQRGDLTCSMLDHAFDVARAAIRRRHPDYDEDAVRQAMIRMLHGDAIAAAAFPGEPLRDP